MPAIYSKQPQATPAVDKQVEEPFLLQLAKSYLESKRTS